MDQDDRSRYRIGDLRVDLASGEVHHPGGEVERLAPQPASLLELLMDHAGEVVERERIREHIWGDVAIDFESSLHYCVRQVRAALGDSASEARFVETLARRGYRLKVRPVAVETLPEADAGPQPTTGLESTATASPGVVSPGALSPTTARAAVGVLTVLLLGLFGLALSGAPSNELTAGVQRLAILPFEPPVGWQDDTHTESVPELLLLRLGQAPASLVVVGPTSTQGHGADGADLDALAADFDGQWAINGRYIEAGDALPGDGRGVLVELIRTSDGAHVWVEAYPLSADPDAVAEEVAAAVSTTVAKRLVR